jgi:outer membrane protein assembly factor BamD
VYRGKPQAQKLMFNYAHTFYLLEDFYLGGYQFERFVTSYPKSDSVEVAAFRSAKSYYQLSPRYTLDQKDTYRGLEKLQGFVNAYPNSSFRGEANELVVELRQKIELKEFETAMQYLRIVQYIGNYRTAIEAFDNFITDHPGSVHRMDAFYHRLEASYMRAMKGVPSKKQERLVVAKEHYQSFLKYYKESELREDADEIMAKINAETEVIETTS